jgi:hypothetical protein
VCINMLEDERSEISAIKASRRGNEMATFELHRLDYWEEATGMIHEVQNYEDLLIVRIGKLRLVVPIEMEKTMRSCIGTKIGILRTDIHDREYIVRSIAYQLRSCPEADEELSMLFGNG